MYAPTTLAYRQVFPLLHLNLDPLAKAAVQPHVAAKEHGGRNSLWTAVERVDPYERYRVLHTYMHRLGKAGRIALAC
jgi:hypothetical protein